MSKFISLFSLSILLLTCSTESSHVMLVKDASELNAAIKQAQAGDDIILQNGVWENIEIEFEAHGTAEAPITLRSETAGQVFIEGRSSLKLSGEYLIVDGLIFRNGFTPSTSVIEFRIDEERLANHSSVVNCVIDGFTQKNRFTTDHWVEFWGQHNALESCSITGKANDGPTVRVFLKGNENIRNYHRIVNNYFGPRPRKGGPHGETLQIGDSGTSMTPSYVLVENNLFDRCNGEVEVISSKSNFNEFRNNVFYHCEGSLVMRHGNYCMIDGNYFIGSEDSEFNGGVRIINTGHWVINNYFYHIRGIEFRSPLAIMNGIPKSPLNRYNQVTDVVVAYNTWIDCKAPWQLGVGANMDMKDVLPLSEIRSARPIRTILANNIIYNNSPDPNPIQSYDKVDGIQFKNNLLDNAGGVESGYHGVATADLGMKQINNWLLTPDVEQPAAFYQTYSGFEFDKISGDISGNSRSSRDNIGAMLPGGKEGLNRIDATQYGAKWFQLNESIISTIHEYDPDGESLSELILKVTSGDIIYLPEGDLELTESIKIDKQITLRGAGGDHPSIVKYAGPENTPLFTMQPRGELHLENIKIQGSGSQYAFETLKQDMSPGYNLWIEGADISGFNHVLLAHKGSFADTLSIANSKVSDCDNGIVLAAETDDKGDYNAEFVTIQNSSFENVNMNVLNFYRGGYDESTIGGVLTVSDSKFMNCGKMEDSNILLKTRGIINVDISNNVFQNNPVKLVALLWGAKNNHHSGNTISRSGEIRVEQQLKLKLMY
ncbi:MAG: alginate lyase [Candidatus Marinimicrobia bacterium]|nr:alginate lyase [Candidatus Neomarinimicrobiota bacterium]